ncbi:putative RNA-directed DNA polymerase [Rosa chinensis]|uniref:Putative RNA-directed DNA polymerase n=1 Tax=Rosa chinensis TaxID=74649 RepID=A0A2P6S9N7_ROSCH|nr:putative RNA-directed DNA polymerase [Rosa chinensis]
MFEKGGGARPEAQMRRFREVINDCGLQDVEFSGPPTTWKHGDTLERLDRCLVNQRAADLFPNLHELHLDVSASDHLALLIYSNRRHLEQESQTRFHRRFQFEVFWTKEEQCEKIILEQWLQDSTQIGVVTKLQRVAQALQSWNKNTVGHILRKIKMLNAKLQQYPFDNLEEGVQESRKLVLSDPRKYMDHEELMWKQKSRVCWLQDGDQNTKFLHGFAKARGRRNKILGVSDLNGNWQESAAGVQQAFIGYFEQLFATEGCNHMELVLDSIHRKVTDTMNCKLAQPFTQLEIEKALKQMPPDKAPGEDGFSAQFYQKYWQVIGDDISRDCLKCLNEGADMTVSDHTLLALIPKVDVPQTLTDFRPISLCNVIYKLMSKAIVNRMKSTLPEVISPFQSAFVPGRCIHDNIIAAFETVHSIRAKLVEGGSKCVLKLDINNAYDRVEWMSLRQIMLQLGFMEGGLSSLCIVLLRFPSVCYGMAKLQAGLNQLGG